ncbi:hypothetical protein BC332_30490 [Capsicum chinense]|nr:hypothetical protein BC332_30490 [Capsicum chinense]
MRPSKEGNRKNKNISSSPKRTRPVNSGADSGSRHFRLSPPPSVSVVDREIVTEDLALFEISPKTNPRSFPYSVKQQCWAKAEKVKGRDPDRWRRDPLGNIVFRKLVGCPGCLCHDYDHITPYSKDNSHAAPFSGSLAKAVQLSVCGHHSSDYYFSHSLYNSSQRDHPNGSISSSGNHSSSAESLLFEKEVCGATTRGVGGRLHWLERRKGERKERQLDLAVPLAARPRERERERGGKKGGAIAMVVAAATIVLIERGREIGEGDAAAREEIVRVGVFGHVLVVHCIPERSGLRTVGLPFNCINYDSFTNFIEVIGQHGSEMEPTTYHEVRVTQLKKDVKKVDELVEKHKVQCQKYGCSLMMDKWTTRNVRMIINILVNCSIGSIFLGSVDASNESTTDTKMYNLFEKTIEDIGPENIVQVVTDNASENVKAGELMRAVYPHIYWTPCAAHCINLMLQGIFKINHMP